MITKMVLRKNNHNISSQKKNEKKNADTPLTSIRIKKKYIYMKKSSDINGRLIII